MNAIRCFLLCLVYCSLYSVDFLLTDPCLQFTGSQAICISWFTTQKGSNHLISCNEGTIVQEANSSEIVGLEQMPPGVKSVWKHEGVVLIEHESSYFVESSDDTGVTHKSPTFCIKPPPAQGKGVKIFLTSDFQQRELALCMLANAWQENKSIDALFFAGDFTARGSSFDLWFTHPLGFFPSFQGRAKGSIGGRSISGAEMIQSVPIVSAFGNHDCDVSKKPSWRTFNELFSLPLKRPMDPPYYSMEIGNIYLIVLAVARIEQKGASFVSISRESEQYNWLLRELSSDRYRNADLKMVMLHHPLYTLRPERLFPIVALSISELRERIDVSNYHWQDVARDFPEYTLGSVLEPLFDQYGVDLVFNGHDHNWNRFISQSGIIYLSTSMASKGISTYGHRLSSRGLRASIPTVAPFQKEGSVVPFIPQPGATFSILDTVGMRVESYYCSPQGECYLFDSIDIKGREAS